MNQDELLKRMQSLLERTEKTEQKIDQLNLTIERMNEELAETFDQEKAEIEAVEKKWAEKRESLTKEIADLAQKKQIIEDEFGPMKEAVDLVSAMFRAQQTMLQKQDVKDGLDILREKYVKSNFESKGPDDLCSDDFDEVEQELDLIPESSNGVDSEEPQAIAS